FMATARLRHTPLPQQRVAMMFWNTPAGEKNLSASNLNVPRSIEVIANAMSAAGYAVNPADESSLIDTAQRLLAAYYRPQETLDALLADGLAATMPLSRYQNWLAALPEQIQQQMQTRWGDPADNAYIRLI